MAVRIAILVLAAILAWFALGIMVVGRYHARGQRGNDLADVLTLIGTALLVVIAWITVLIIERKSRDPNRRGDYKCLRCGHYWK